MKWILSIWLAAGTALFGWGVGEMAQQFSTPGDQSLPRVVPRGDRTKPLVVIVGENSNTELTDFVVPYGILARSNVAEVMTVGTRPGPIRLFPSLSVIPQSTVAAFDEKYPIGADVVIVPAVHRSDDPTLLRWVRSQYSKGSIVVGICDGVWVLGNAGLLEHKSFTTHWNSVGSLMKRFKTACFRPDRRYVCDGRIITTTGVTASIPVSLALVEAIGGKGAADAVAGTIGHPSWSTAHASSDFILKPSHVWTAVCNLLLFWRHETFGVEIQPGADEVALALAVDAYGRTYKSKVYSWAFDADYVKTRNGLQVYVDRKGLTSPTSSRIELSTCLKPSEALDVALVAIGRRYGDATRGFVELQMEYPSMGRRR